jgi:prevent-host-death family protein
MPEIGIKELKTHASAIVREVRDEKARYVVTFRGRPASLLVPLEDPAANGGGALAGRAEGAWAELERLGEEIGRGWQAEESSADLLSRMRR